LVPSETIGIRKIKRSTLVIEMHHDGYVAYPVGLRGVVVGQGDTYESALNGVHPAIRIHRESFGLDAIKDAEPCLIAFAAAISIAPSHSRPVSYSV
jgi:predicted RNase H-like HicB family nuclease